MHSPKCANVVQELGSPLFLKDCISLPPLTSAPSFSILILAPLTICSALFCFAFALSSFLLKQPFLLACCFPTNTTKIVTLIWFHRCCKSKISCALPTFPCIDTVHKPSVTRPVQIWTVLSKTAPRWSCLAPEALKNTSWLTCFWYSHHPIPS